jgi:hypothetical protein
MMDRRPSGLPALLTCGLGGITGAITAFAIGLMDAPEVDPNVPLAFEWYTPFVLFILPFYGLIIGVVVGFLYSSPALIYGLPGPNSWVGGLAGLLLGLVVGKILIAGRSDGKDLILHLLVTAAMTFFGLLIGPKGTKKKLQHSDDIEDWDVHGIL